MSDKMKRVRFPCSPFRDLLSKDEHACTMLSMYLEQRFSEHWVVLLDKEPGFSPCGFVLRLRSSLSDKRCDALLDRAVEHVKHLIWDLIGHSILRNKTQT